MTYDAGTVNPVGLAFDRLAADYDSIFTSTVIGKSQREVVWRRLLSVFPAGAHVLELNCGTGQDALFMAHAGMRVTACDASSRMIEQARQRIAGERLKTSLEFVTLPIEEMHELPETSKFDGLFSNFGGLNCVQDLSGVAREAGRRLKPGAPLLLCFLSRFCLWEILYFLLRGNPRKALRRCWGSSVAHIDELSFPVYYPSLSLLRRIFEPEFRLVSTAGVGIAVAPSYVERWIAAHPRLLRRMEAIDELVCEWPGLRIFGDHMLLHFERVRPS